MIADPFGYHPELRDKIKDPAGSFLRGTTLQTISDLMDKHGLEKGWWFSDASRESARKAFLSPYLGADMWVFAYGSLMTDPGFHFRQLRRAILPGYNRRFILRDVYGGRGHRGQPGLMAALDASHDGSGCDGLAFCIDKSQLEVESTFIWKREMIAPGYIPTIAPIFIDGTQVPALTFVADHSAELIAPDLTRDQQIHYIATGSGFMGTSLEYIENIAQQFEILGIQDDEVTGLLNAVHDRIKAA